MEYSDLVVKHWPEFKRGQEEKSKVKIKQYTWASLRRSSDPTPGKPHTTSSLLIDTELVVCGFPHLMCQGLSSSLKTLMWRDKNVFADDLEMRTNTKWSNFKNKEELSDYITQKRNESMEEREAVR